MQCAENIKKGLQETNKILIVDDDKDIQVILSEIIKTEGYESTVAGDGRKALKQIRAHLPDLIFLDVKLPGMNGLEVLEEIKKINRDIVVVMLTGYGNIKDAVQAMKSGAYDYLTKPFAYEEIVFIIKKALQEQYLIKETQGLYNSNGMAVAKFVGESPKIKHVLSQVELVAPTNMTVIIQGESGTGKELIARMLHQKSPRHNEPFITVDCGVIPENLVESELFGYEKGAFTGAAAKKEGKFELANKGTLFLDEVTNLPLQLQTKLLRVLQERKICRLGSASAKEIKIDVRVIAATNTILTDKVKEESFREDLYHRLSEFNIELPALRERKEDMPILAEHFLREANLELNKKIEDISSEALQSLLAYNWPGNLREMKNEIRKAALLTDSNFIREINLPLEAAFNLSGDYFSDKIASGISLQETIKKNIRMLEREIIEKALLEAKYNKTKAAKILHIDRMTLYSKMKSLGL